MDVREKLVELLCDGIHRMDLDYPEAADYLIAHGVTVQERKPLEVFLHPIDAYKGLKAKYLVFKADTGAKVDNCFVLRPDKDSVAVEALRAYASATNNGTLAEDIYNWVGEGKPAQAQEWISVKERLPESMDDVLVWYEYRGYNGSGGLSKRKIKEYGIGCYIPQMGVWSKDPGIGTDARVIAWMPLPQPPKGE